MAKDARLAQLEKWLTKLFQRPFAEVCLDCPPSDPYFRAREIGGVQVPDLDPRHPYPCQVRLITKEGAVVAVVLALRGIGVDPQRVERYIQEQEAARDFQIREGASGFGYCCSGKRFLAAVEALLD